MQNKKSKQSVIKMLKDRKFIFCESITSKNKNNLYKFIDQYLENNPEDENELVIINTQAKTLTEEETMNKNNQGFNQTQMKQLADMVTSVVQTTVPPMIEEAINRLVPPMIEAAVAPLREEIKEIKQDVANLKQEVKEIKQDIKLIKSCPTIKKELQEL